MNKISWMFWDSIRCPRHLRDSGKACRSESILVRIDQAAIAIGRGPASVCLRNLRDTRLSSFSAGHRGVKQATDPLWRDDMASIRANVVDIIKILQRCGSDRPVPERVFRVLGGGHTSGNKAGNVALAGVVGAMHMTGQYGHAPVCGIEDIKKPLTPLKAAKTVELLQT